MGRLGDHILQVIFVGALVAVMLLLYFGRLAGLRADDPNRVLTDSLSDRFVTVYQYEQEEKRLEDEIAVRQSDYARSVITYQEERKKIELSRDLSELEKREKTAILEDVYSGAFWQKKLDLLEEIQMKLKVLRTAKCARFCVFGDLPEAG